jgi:hypothetical protein
MCEEIVAFCGFIGSGKDTCADYLIKNHGFVKLSFAGILKDILSIIFGWDRIMLDGLNNEDRKWRETIDTWWAEKLKIENFSPRYAMRFIGTDLFRNCFNKDLWTISVERSLSKYKKVVITDCRFPNEINMLQKYNTVLIHVIRNLPHWYDDYKNKKIENVDMHSSDISWIHCTINLEIYNNGTIEDLHNNLKSIF